MPRVSRNARARIVVPWALCLVIGVAGLIAQTRARTLDIYNSGLDNAPAMFVANVDDGATVAGVLAPPAGDGQGGGRGGRGGAAAAHAPAYLIKISVESDGTFVVTNTSNGFRKTYRPRQR